MKVRCRYTGLQLEGDYVRADPLETYPECPECGAEEGEPCMAQDPANDGFGVELDQYVHAAREAELCLGQGA